MPVQPAFDDGFCGTGRGPCALAFGLVHVEAAHVQPLHVVIALVWGVGVARQTGLQGTRYLDGRDRVLVRSCGHTLFLTPLRIRVHNKCRKNSTVLPILAY